MAKKLKFSDWLTNQISNISKEKSAILVTFNTNTDLEITEAWVQKKIPFDTVGRKIGNGFSLSNDGTVVASSDVKRFRATVGVRLLESYSVDVYPRICSESGASWYTDSGYQKSTTQIRNETVDTCVNNKNIYSTLSSSRTGTVKLRGDFAYTYMLVEEL